MVAPSNMERGSLEPTMKAALVLNDSEVALSLTVVVILAVAVAADAAAERGEEEKEGDELCANSPSGPAVNPCPLMRLGDFVTLPDASNVVVEASGAEEEAALEAFPRWPFLPVCALIKKRAAGVDTVRLDVAAIAVRGRDAVA